MTKPKSNTWMPFYVGDYLRKTTRLTLELHGAYLLLILDSWTNGPPPDHDDTLAAITRTSMAKWLKMRPILAEFFDIKDGRWVQERVDQERAKAFAVTEVRSMAGKEGAARRWGRGKGMANAIGEPLAKPKQTGSQTDGPSQSQLNNPSTESVPGRGRTTHMSEAAMAMLKESLERAAGR